MATLLKQQACALLQTLTPQPFLPILATTVLKVQLSLLSLLPLMVGIVAVLDKLGPDAAEPRINHGLTPAARHLAQAPVVKQCDLSKADSDLFDSVNFSTTHTVSGLAQVHTLAQDFPVVSGN